MPLFIEKASKVVQKHLNGPLFDDPTTQRIILENLEELARKAISNKRAAGIAVKACKQALNDVVSRITYDSQDFSSRVCEQYVRYVFEDSTSGLHHTPRHDSGVDHEVIEARMQVVLPEMENPISGFAKQIKNSGSVDKLRVSPEAKLEQATNELLDANPLEL